MEDVTAPLLAACASRLINFLADDEPLVTVDRDEIAIAMEEAFRLADRAISTERRDNCGYWLGAFAAALLMRYENDIFPFEQPRSGFVEAYLPNWRFVEGCALLLACEVIRREHDVRIALEDKLDLVAEFKEELEIVREATTRPFVGVTGLTSVLLQFPDKPQVTRVADDALPPAETEQVEIIEADAYDALAEARQPRRALRIASFALVLVLSAAIGGVVGRTWTLASAPAAVVRPTLDPPAPPSKRGPAALGGAPNLRTKLLVYNAGSNGPSAQSVAGLSPEESFFTEVQPLDPEHPDANKIDIDLYLGLRDDSVPAPRDPQLAFGIQAPLVFDSSTPTMLFDQEHPDGTPDKRVGTQSEFTHAVLNADRTDIVYRFKVSLGDPTSYSCGYNITGIYALTTDGSGPLVINPINVIVLKNCG